MAHGARKEEGGTEAFLSLISSDHHGLSRSVGTASNDQDVADRLVPDAKARTLSRQAAAGEMNGLMRLVALSDFYRESLASARWQIRMSAAQLIVPFVLTQGQYIESIGFEIGWTLGILKRSLRINRIAHSRLLSAAIPTPSTMMHYAVSYPNC